MLRNTFIHCRGIAKKKESSLKLHGINTWQDALKPGASLPLGSGQKKKFIDDINQGITALNKADIAYFIESLPIVEQWRILAHFQKDISFLDIETTGFSPSFSEVSIICLYHKQKFHTFVKGINLKKFLPFLSDIKLLTTFCGSHFDIPHLKEALRIPYFPCPHIDLRWQCYHLGLRGGLKNIETKLGLSRPPNYQGITGQEAIELWYSYKNTQDLASLKKLKIYSLLDVLSLRLLLMKILEKRQTVMNKGLFENLKTMFSSEKKISEVYQSLN